MHRSKTRYLSLQLPAYRCQTADRFCHPYPVSEPA